jgi:hypothetical protein
MTYSDILSQIHRLLDEIQPPDDDERSHLVYRQKQYLKWRLLHEYVRCRPFRVDPRQPRSRQWQEAMNKVRHLRDKEVIDCLWLQADIARNHEKGIQDMRPPMRGNCHEALVTYLRMREHKALVVLQWEEGAQEHGCYRVNSAFHARTQEILQRLREKNSELLTSDDDSLDDPWLRS